MRAIGAFLVAAERKDGKDVDYRLLPNCETGDKGSFIINKNKIFGYHFGIPYICKKRII